MPACPRCHQALAPLGVPAGSALGCSACSGVFLDDAAFGHVRDSLYARILERAPGGESRSRGPDQSNVLACPTCSATLRRTRVDGVDVDFCAGHGTWFDRDELVLVARAIAVQKAYGAKAPSGAPAPVGRIVTDEEREALERSVASRPLSAVLSEGVSGEGLLEAFGDVVRTGDRYDD